MAIKTKLCQIGFICIPHKAIGVTISYLLFNAKIVFSNACNPKKYVNGIPAVVANS